MSIYIPSPSHCSKTTTSIHFSLTTNFFRIANLLQSEYIEEQAFIDFYISASCWRIVRTLSTAAIATIRPVLCQGSFGTTVQPLTLFIRGPFTLL
jgi:hypothetical protein